LLAIESLKQRRIIGRLCIEAVTVHVIATDFLPLNHDIPDLALIDIVLELGKAKCPTMPTAWAEL
jgi:hypothetical protein